MNIIFCPTLYEIDSLGKYAKDAIVTGMGKLNMLHACYRHKEQIEKAGAVLIGYCGLLKGEYKIGDTVNPSCYIDGDYNAYPVEDSIHFIETKPRPAIACVSVERILTKNSFQDICEAFKAAICDMESYAFVEFCKKFDVDYKVIRIISDIVGKDSAEQFKQACQTNALERSLDEYFGVN